MKTPTRPEPLSNTEVHHPRTVRAWKAAEADYFAAVRAQKQAAEQKAEQKAHPKQLTEDEQYELAVKQDDAKKAEQAKAAQRESAKEKAHQEWLASSPDRVELLENSLYALIMAVQHWVNRGYQVVENTVDSIPPSLFACHLFPAPKLKK